MRGIILNLMFCGWAAAAPACEVALALTIDVSGSVDPHEYEIQMGGLAAALRDGAVAEALVDQKAAIMVVQWTGNNRQAVIVPWQHIREFDQVTTIARQVEIAPRSWRHFSTAIGAALLYTAEKFRQVPDCKRKVIDVSGDGPSNEGQRPEDLKELLAEAGFVVNALAIETSAVNLTEYFDKNVITGVNSFVMTAHDFEDYPKQIRRKLMREVVKQIAALDVKSSN